MPGNTSKVCIFQFSNSNVNIYNIVRWFLQIFSHTKDWWFEWCLHLFLSYFFSSSRLSPTATALSFSRFTPWVMSGRVDFSFSTALSFSIFTWRDFCPLFLLLWIFQRTFHWIFHKERLAWKDTLKIEICSCYIWKPHHFLPLENFLPVLGIEPGSALPIMSLMHLLQSSIDADMKLDNSSSRWGVYTLSLEVPCQGSWCRCQTYTTWAPRGCLPS